jgi:uncharacterized protein
VIEARLIRKTIEGYSLPVMGLHGLPHWARVLDNGLKLADETGAERQVVALFAVLHDARRLNEGSDPGHGARAGALASELRADYLDLTDAEFELLVTACVHHTDGMVEGDVTVQTCWDADRLDLWRVCTEPAYRLLCTPEAKMEEIRDWCRERSLSDYMPDYVMESWLADP